MKKLALLLIKAYQLLISPLIGSNCRYQPTCSHYAATVIERFGMIPGGWMAIKRIARCHPWREGGYDPAPEKSKKI